MLNLSRHQVGSHVTHRMVLSQVGCHHDNSYNQSGHGCCTVWFAEAGTAPVEQKKKQKNSFTNRVFSNTHCGIHRRPISQGMLDISIAEMCLKIMIGHHSHTSKGLTHWGRDNMAAISQKTLSNTFSWTKMLEFQVRFHWCVFRAHTYPIHLEVKM